MTKIPKRKFIGMLRGLVWITPVVYLVNLPSHAETSPCSILSTWRLEVFGYTEDFALNITFLAGGTTDNPFIHTWEVNGNSVRMTQDLSDWIFTGSFSGDCSIMSGTYVSFIIQPVEPDVIFKGTWQAEKIRFP